MNSFRLRELAIAVVAVIVFGFLWINSQAINYREHEYFNQSLRQYKEINAIIDREIFEIRYGILTYYDPINQNIKNLKALQQQLKQAPSFIQGQQREKLNEVLEANARLIQEKESLIEQFKSRNAVLNNSLIYFPTLATELAQKAAAVPRGHKLADCLNQLLREVLIYNLNSREKLAPKIEAELETLLQIERESKTQVKPREIEFAIAYVRTILTHKPQVDELIERLVSLPIWERSEDLYKVYDRYYEEALKTANIYRVVLYLFSLSTIGGTAAYIIIKLNNSAIALTSAKEKLQDAFKATREAEAKYRTIFENVTEGIFQTSRDGKFLSANPALARILGYDSPEEAIELIGNIEKQLYVEASRRQDFIDLIEKSHLVADFESQVYCKDGSIIWICENTRAVYDSNNEFLYYEGTLQDITVRKLTLEALRYQQEQTEKLLLNILPEPIAERLKRQEGAIADSFNEVTVVFADIVGFTEISSQISPKELVQELNIIFSGFDQLSEKHGLEKIKTIGDAYMVVAGLPHPRVDGAEAAAEMALDMQEKIRRLSSATCQPFSIRIGMHTGPVVAGVIGIKKFSYDLWGDTVNTASRMESQGISGCIQVTTETYERLKHKYLFEERGFIKVKGKGMMKTYLLLERKLCPSSVKTIN